MSSEGCAEVPREQSCAAIKLGPQRHWPELKKKGLIVSIQFAGIAASSPPPFLGLHLSIPPFPFHRKGRSPRRTQASILPPHPTPSPAPSCILHSASATTTTAPLSPFQGRPVYPPGSLRIDGGGRREGLPRIDRPERAEVPTAPSTGRASAHAPRHGSVPVRRPLLARATGNQTGWLLAEPSSTHHTPTRARTHTHTFILSHIFPQPPSQYDQRSVRLASPSNLQSWPDQMRPAVRAFDPTR